MCKCSLSLSLLFTLRLSLFCALSQVRKRELSTHQSPYRPTADGGTSGPLCFRFTLPVAACCRPLHFRCRCDSEAVQQFRVAAPFGWCVPRIRRGDPRGTGKIDSSPPAYGVSPHARPHMQCARHPRAQPTHQHQRNLSTFLFSSPSPSLLCSAGTWFQWFSSHSGVFQSFVTIFSYFHAQTYVHTYTHTLACGGILRTLSK